MEPRVLAFRHTPEEPLGYIATILTGRSVPFSYIDLWENDGVPRVTDATHLIFLGGPMSVNDEAAFPWLKEEKEIIRRSAKHRQKVLGICLGAQLIASARGAAVYRFVQETGWHILRRGEDVPGIFSSFPNAFPAFQLHGETFEIPYGGRLLASGSAVRNQAFVHRNALGLQFHLEMTGELVTRWSKDLRKHAVAAIRRDTPRYLMESNRLCRLVMDDFLR